jgi:hypothetical protein
MCNFKKLEPKPQAVMTKTYSNAEDEDAVLLTEENVLEEEKIPDNKNVDIKINGNVRLRKSGSEVVQKNDAEDSSDDLPNEEHFNYKITQQEDAKEEGIAQIKNAIMQKFEEMFVKMRVMNKANKQRLKRDPVWMWEDEKESPDPLETSNLRILSVTWNMNGK